MLREIINKHKMKLVMIGDILVFYLSLLLTLTLRYAGINTFSKFHTHFLPFSFLLLIWIVVFYIIDLYSYTNLKANIKNKKRFLVGVIVNFILSLSVFYIFGNTFFISPKLNLVLFALIFLTIDYLWRYFFSWLLAKKLSSQKILLVSSSLLNKPIMEHIRNYPQLGYLIQEYTENDFIKNEINYNKNNTIVVNDESFDNPEMLKKLYNLISNNTEIIPLTNFYEKLLSKIPLIAVKEEWFINEIKLQNHINDSLKNILDKFLALVLLIILSPIILLIALLVKTTSVGPILYKQIRVGKNGKLFTLIKFRTMYATTSKNPDANGDSPTWCEIEDKRVTIIVGRILRTIHLDELPQLFNIINNNLSFVGPRPERPEFVQILEKEIPYYLFRQNVKPGLTGWAQIKFRYSRTVIDSKEKFEYDLFYMKNRNIFLDCRVILKTIQLVFTH